MPDFTAFLNYSLTTYEAFTSASGQLNNTINYELLAPGVLAFYPIESTNSKSIVLSSGVHGNETAPIEILDRMIADIASGILPVYHRVLFIFGNLPAIAKQQRFIVENLNRLFVPEINEGNEERRRALELMQIVSAFYATPALSKHHYDLHTAIRASKNEKFAVYPYLHGGAHNKQELAFLSACGVNTILLSQSPTGTFSYFSSSQCQAHAFTVELGKVKPFGQNDMNKFVATDAHLRALISLPEVPLDDFADCPIEVYTVNQTILKQQEDFVLHFAEDTPNFTDFKQGQLIASETGKEYRAEHAGEAIVFPNAQVPIGQRALLTVIPYAL